MKRFLFLIFVSCALTGGSASAEIWTVLPDGSGDAPTIQAGIDSASAGDTVRVFAGTYYEYDIILKSGIYLTSETGSMDCVVIDANSLGRGLYCDGVDSTSIIGFGIVHGMAREDSGGAMLCVDSDLRVTNCAFRHSFADYGGGGVYIGKNLPSFTGGGSPVFTNCDFSYNRQLYEYRGGGGVWSSAGSPVFVGCTFLYNESEFGAGGGFGCTSSCRPTFEGCTFAWNRGSGAGVAFTGTGFAQLINCTFANNRSLGGGGAVYFMPAASGSLDHCIMAHTVGGNGVNCEGLVASLTCCDIYGNNWGDWVNAIADQYGVNGNISEDPLFCDPEEDDFRLSCASPCLDSASCGTMGAYGSGCCFEIVSIADVQCDDGGHVSLTWNRIWHDYAGSDTVVDYYSLWRRVGATSSPGMLANPPGTWEYVDSMEASAQGTYTIVCPTACDSGGPGICWSVFCVRAHFSVPLLEMDSAPDSGYSVDDTGEVAWTDVTTPVLCDSNWAQGISWVDYDNDDDLDIFITNRLTENRLFRNDDLTPGGFVEATPPILADASDSKGCAWGDYDNDGDLDLYVTNDGLNRLYRNDGSGTFVDVTPTPLFNSSPGQAASWVDYDNDGDVDLYLVNAGANKLFRNDGGGAFTDATFPPLGNSGKGRGCGWADYDDDGDMDVYIANRNGANALLENQGGGMFVDATTPVTEFTCNSTGVAWGDYDNDGDLDLYVTNDGANALLQNNGGSFSDVTNPPVDDAGQGRSAAWGDYDLDGDLDLYLVNEETPNKLFQNDGGGSFVVRSSCEFLPVEDSGLNFSSAWADFDKDGDLDMYLVSNGTNRLLRNELDTTHHWLEVSLVGMISNSFGLGARVRVVAGGVSQIREIAGASGYLSQGPLTAWFGLDDVCTVDTVEVTWPASGIVRLITAVTCDQTLEVEEDPLARVPDEEKTPTVFMLYPNRPNPFAGKTVIRYDLPERSQVDLAIYDASGRFVCMLISGEYQQPGRHQAHWDGRNSEGKPAAPGIYFCRFTAGHHIQNQRLVLLK
ncbi:MAG: FG-GAP-like repeat-containing protein [Candidatus Eisenbacteria bacterium]